MAINTNQTMGHMKPWCTPLKIIIKPENDGLEDDFPDFKWVIFRFHVNLPWCDILVKKKSRQTNPCHDVMAGGVQRVCLFHLFFLWGSFLNNGC